FIFLFLLTLSKFIHMRTLLLAGFFLSVITPAFAQQEDSIFIKRISDEIFLNGKAYDNLRDLTKKIGGRLSGSPQMVKAEQWGLKTMQLSGADKAWLQECRVPHWVRGGKDEVVTEYDDQSSRKIKPTKRAVDVVALGNSMGSGAKGV